MVTKSYYHEITRQLLPRGKAWEDYSWACEALADWALGGAQALKQMQANFYPLTADGCLDDFESVFGLPDACTVGAQTTDERRRRILGKMNERGDLSKSFYINLAKSLGYTITFTELKPATSGRARCGSPVNRVGSPLIRFMWIVNVYGLPISYNRAGRGRCGKSLSQITHATVLECVIRKYEPAHTLLIFNYPPKF